MAAAIGQAEPPEARVSRPGHLNREGAGALDFQAFWIWGLVTALVLYLGLDGGGYDLLVRSRVTVLIWWIVLLGAVFAVLPAGRVGRSALAAISLLGGFTAWSWVAASWSLSLGNTLQEVSRLAGYLGVLVLAVMTYGDRRRALAHVVGALAFSITLIALIAVISRLRPGTFGGSHTTAAFLPGSHGRLSWPLNYWNALAALVALGLPLLLCIATSARRTAAQAAAAGAIPAVALCGYLTFSRGGAIAWGIAIVVFVALAPDRLPKLATIALCAAGSAVLISGAVHRSAIEQGLVGSAARHQGSGLLVLLVVVCVLIAGAQAGLAFVMRRWSRPALLAVPVNRARVLLAIGVVVLIVAALAAGAPHRLSHAWQVFKQTEAANLHQNALGRFGALSGNGRYMYWKVGLDAMGGHWLGGFGPGTFQFVWMPRAPYWSYVINAHSLYVETLIETGVVGLALVVGLLGLAQVLSVRRVIGARGVERTLAAATAAAVAAFIFSAGFDWIWQVPVLPVALLLLAAALVGPRPPAESSPSAESSPPAESSPSTARPRRRSGRLLARPVTIVVALVCFVAIGIPMADVGALRDSEAAARSGNTTAALADARTAAAIEPNAAAPQMQIALVLEAEGQIAAAIDAEHAATRDEPQNWQTWFTLSRLEAEAGHPVRAIKALTRARSLNPQSPLF